MKVVRNLGMKTVESTGRRVRFGVFMCPYCNKEVTRRMSQGKRQKSCGCYRYNKTHSCKPRGVYVMWTSMRQRCKHRDNEKFKHWAGRGISVCEEWENSYESFRDWALGNGYKKGLQIDRINNDLGYSPNNCRFVPSSINNRNRRDNKFKQCQIDIIRDLYKTGMFLQRELADLFNTKEGYIQQITANRCWT